jgi:hypothetical protein
MSGPEMTDEDRRALGGVMQMLAAATANGVGAQYGVLATALANGSLVPVQAAIGQMLDLWQARLSRRTTALVTEAASFACVEVAELCDWSMAESRRLSLAVRAISIAVATEYEEKLGFLASAWSQAISDQAMIDVLQVKIESVRNLEASHSVVLGILASESRGLKRSAIAELAPVGYAEVLDPLLQTIVSSGLAVSGGGFGLALGHFLPVEISGKPDELEWHITPHGCDIFHELRVKG